MRASRRRRRLVALAAVALVLIVGTASAFGTVRDLVLGAPAKSQIAFVSFRDGQFDAYVMNTNGSGQRRLTARPDVFFPVWSPDGRKIVYAQGWPDNADIYVMNADGSGLRRLTRDPAWTAVLSGRLTGGRSPSPGLMLQRKAGGRRSPTSTPSTSTAVESGT